MESEVDWKLLWPLPVCFNILNFRNRLFQDNFFCNFQEKEGELPRGMCFLAFQPEFFLFQLIVFSMSFKDAGGVSFIVVASVFFWNEHIKQNTQFWGATGTITERTLGFWGCLRILKVLNDHRNANYSP